MVFRHHAAIQEGPDGPTPNVLISEINTLTIGNSNLSKAFLEMNIILQINIHSNSLNDANNTGHWTVITCFKAKDSV